MSPNVKGVYNYATNTPIVQYTSADEFEINPQKGVLSALTDSVSGIFSKGIPSTHASYLGHNFPIAYNYR